MKKLLSLLLAVTLLCALSPAVFADDPVQNKDYVAFYLTKYEVQSGDTLMSICKARNIEYATYLSIIKNVNGIANENSLIAGRSYWLPAKALGSATEYYAVYRHILVAGDTISGLCTTYGISLANNEALLKAVNNVTSLTGFMAGTSIYIPVSSGTAATTTPTTGTTTTTGTVTTPTTGATTTTGTTTATDTTAAGQNQDYVAFYLTPYQVQSGDTLSSICAARGINFGEYLTIIQGVNKLASYNYLIAGRSYWIPAKSVGSASSYYTVYRHTLVQGDTVYGLCQAYGISMTKYTDMILKLNNATSLTGFMAGRPILLPVFHEGSSGGSTIVGGVPTDTSSAGQSTGSSTTTTTTNPDGTVTTTTTTTTTTVTEDPNLFNAATAERYYLVPYVVKSGDSLISICNSLKTSFSANKDLIATVNSLASYSLSVGQELYIPVQSPSGSRYYTVLSHAMAAGETVYGICTAAGGDFSASYKMLTALNAGVNFNWLNVGQKIAIPVYHG